jgi:hypothetical protein
MPERAHRCAAEAFNVRRSRRPRDGYGHDGRHPKRYGRVLRWVLWLRTLTAPDQSTAVELWS